MEKSKNQDFPVQEAFINKSIAITGATGFIGKVLLEKLLRDVPGINKIFILMREKRGKSIAERMKLFRSLEVFRRIESNLFDKIVVIKADLKEEKFFGITDTDKTLLENEVSFVFHVAATVRFDETVEDAVRINLIATRTLVRWAESFKRLESFVYVSTAYSNVQMSCEIEEKIYASEFKWREVIDIVEGGKKCELIALSEKVAKKFPNTYAFSKNLAEQLVEEKSSKLPMVILRPPIVMPTYTEPFPGWVDFRGTIIGVQAGVSAGLLRHFYGDEETKINVIHCDHLVNATIIASARASFENNGKLKVYNLTPKSGAIKLGDFRESVLKNACEVAPSAKVLYYPRFYHYKNYWIFLTNIVIFQLIPAVIIDMILWISTKNFKYTKIVKKLYNAVMDLNFFVFNTFEFSCRNFLELSKVLNEKDR